MTARRALGLAAGLSAFFASALASACPTCASREEAGSMRWIALGLLMISPWIVAGVVALYIRQGLRAAREAAHPLASPLAGDASNQPRENFQ